MAWLNWIISILFRWLAPIALKFFLWDIDIYTSLILILFFSGLPSLLKGKSYRLFSKKKFLLDLLLISIFTIVHYLWNFYGIIFGNIIITTLIIKNSPFFQSIIYSIIYKKSLTRQNYIIALLLVIWMFFVCYSPGGIKVKILFILIPLLSSFARAALMIMLSKIDHKNEALWFSNITSSMIMLILSLALWKFNFVDLSLISGGQYIVYIILWILPTFICPILRANSIKKLWNNIIFLDYITPIVTIIFSLFLFKNNLSTYNYIWILIIILSIFSNLVYTSNTINIAKIRIFLSNMMNFNLNRVKVEQKLSKNNTIYANEILYALIQTDAGPH